MQNKITLVTGGRSGIGYEIAKQFLQEGSKVIIASRKEEPLAKAAEELSTYGEVSHKACDIRQTEQIQSLAEFIKDKYGQLDILVNNAGAAWGEEFATHSETGWDRTMDLNVKGLFYLTQALHPLLKSAATFERPAKVINIASIDGLKINPWQTYSYQASKAAVIHLTRRLAAELITDNIQVTGIAPGAFQSDMNKAARDHGEEVGKNIPFPRIGAPEDMAGVAIFLASRAGDYVVGETVTCDGGIVHASLPGNSIDL